jgi:hypothetical protein
MPSANSLVDGVQLRGPDRVYRHKRPFSLKVCAPCFRQTAAGVTPKPTRSCVPAPEATLGMGSSAHSSRWHRSRGRPPPGSRLSGFRSAVNEDLLDHPWVLNAGDDTHCPSAGRACFLGHIPVPDRFSAAYGCANRRSARFVDVDAQDPFQALRLRLNAARRSAGVGSSESPCGRHSPPLPRLAHVTRSR